MSRSFGSVFLTLTAAVVCRGGGLTVTPSSGRGATQVFTLTASAPRGSALNSVAILINAELRTSRSCYASYSLLQKTISLENDGGDGWVSSGQPGTRAVLGNDQCSVDLGRSSVSDTPVMRVKLAITFQPHFAGSKMIWLEAGAGWEKMGTWSAVAAINLGVPAWTPIMTSSTAPEYFKYSGAEKTEAKPSNNRITLPHHFFLPDSSSTAVLSGVCRIPASAPDAPPFWFDFSGNPLGGKAKSTIPSEYFVSPIASHAGLKMRASFGGAASGAGVLYETAYFHQQRCDAGGLEYGFYRNVIAGQTVFYISNNSNCGIQPNSYCHVSDSYSSDYVNENNYPGQALTTNINGWEIKNLNINGAPAQLSNLYYSVFIVPDRSAPKGYRFQVEVFGPTMRHAHCDVHDTAGNILFINQPCGFPVRPEGWYPIDRLSSGYVTVGIQRQGTPTIVTPVDFAVDQLTVPTGKAF